MFVGRAVLGTHYQTAVGMPGNVRPPCVHGHGAQKPSDGGFVGCAHPRADSVVYNNLAAGKFREFIVYENAMAYPEYLIQYERWAGGRKVSG